MKVAKTLLSFYWNAVTVHQIQSPLAYELATALLEDKRYYYAFDAFNNFNNPTLLKQVFRMLQVVKPQKPFIFSSEKWIHYCHQAALGTASFIYEKPDYLFFKDKLDLDNISENQYIVVIDYWKYPENIEKVELWLNTVAANLVIQTRHILLISKQPSIQTSQYFPIVPKSLKFWKLGLWQK